MDFFKKKDKGPRMVNYAWVLAGIYLMYLAGELIISAVKGTATNFVINILAAVLFLAAGVYLCLREWNIYRYGAPEDRSLNTETADELSPEELSADELSPEEATEEEEE